MLTPARGSDSGSELATWTGAGRSAASALRSRWVKRAVSLTADAARAREPGSARGTIRCRLVDASVRVGACVDRAGVGVCAVERRARHADAIAALIVRSAEAAVITRVGVVDVRADAEGIAEVVGARVAVVAELRDHALAVHAGLGGARATVVAVRVQCAAGRYEGRGACTRDGRRATGVALHRGGHVVEADVGCDDVALGADVVEEPHADRHVGDRSAQYPVAVAVDEHAVLADGVDGVTEQRVLAPEHRDRVVAHVVDGIALDVGTAADDEDAGLPAGEGGTADRCPVAGVDEHLRRGLPGFGRTMAARGRAAQEAGRTEPDLEAHLDGGTGGGPPRAPTPSP